MQYLGGKSRLGRKIVEAIQPWRSPGSLWVEPFCGALNVTRWAPSPRLALDACQPLITTLQAVQQGWEPPDHVTPETYAAIRTNPDPWDPLTGFVMFGCSFGGKWGAGYSRQDTRWGQRRGGGNPAGAARKGLLEKIQDCQDTIIRCLDYRRIPAPPPGTVIYADPPYEATTGYDGVPPFNSSEFWQWADWWHRCGALVFVSEGRDAVVPPSWTTYQTWIMPTYLGGGTRQPREERLYVHRDSLMARSLTHHAQ